MTPLTVGAAVAVLGISLSAAMALAWLVQQRTGNSGWVDAVWTFGLGAIGAASAMTPVGGDTTERPVIVAVLIAIWALRLGAHIALRTRKIDDDPRYAALAAGWGSDAPRQMFWLLQKQALVTVPLALSLFLAAHNPSPLNYADGFAVAVAVAAIVGEAVADHQLRSFRADPANRGQVCDTGLWAWSRHPNYFFEWLGWLAYPLLAIDLGGAYSWGWLALAAPICMYWLLAHVSGVPPLEQHMLKSRGAAYRDYQARTSVFFPAPPRARPSEAAQ